MEQSVLRDIEARRDRLARELAERDSAAKKSGGAVYTPPQIVSYLVERTVGKLLEGKTAADAADLRILDPACGAGAFLLAAFRFLLGWHAKSRGSQLSPAERRRILLDSIFGVDIDPVAVELCRLSLLLAALDPSVILSEAKDLSGEPAPAHGASPADRVSPSEMSLAPLRSAQDDTGVERNIRLGDALLGPDFARQDTLFDNAPPAIIFDWPAGFPEVFSGNRPGFDLVLGNPPYLSYSGREAVPLDPAVRAYFASHYETAGWPTAHGLFIERAVKLLSRRLVAFIVPDQVGHLAGYRAVRALIARHSRLAEVRYWGEDVFPGVVTPALTFIADREHRGAAAIFPPEGSNTFGRVGTGLVAPSCTLLKGLEPSGGKMLEPLGGGPGAPWIASHHSGLLDKLRERSFSLGDLVADAGVHSGNCSRKLICPLDDAPSGAVPVLEGKQISRYACIPPAKALRLDLAPEPGEYFTIRPIARYEAAPFLVRQTAAYPIVGPRRGAVYFRNSLLALYPPTDGLDVRYLVALLNSKLLRFVYTELVPESRQRAFPQVKVGSLRQLPIRALALSDPSDAEAHAHLVALVDHMLALQAALAAASGDARTSLARQIDAADRTIDCLVCQLYGLTPSAAAVVDGTAR